MTDSARFIPLFDLDYGPEEEEAVLRVLRRKWLTMGEETEAFEKEFARYIGVRHAIAVSNCTAALHLANLAVGVQAGDEVIVPSLTFVATSNSILYAGGKPVFADVASLDDWTISPRDIEAKLTSRTKAIAVVHYAGFVCDMDAIMAIARKHGLKVIEDVAHAIGVSHGGRQAGSLGDVSCFSFFSNKNVATGEGGMVCTNDDAMAARMRLYRSHGMTTLTLDRHKGHSFTYDVVQPGFNYRLDEMRAALGRVQLAKLDSGNARRIAAADLYKEKLRAISSVRIPFSKVSRNTNYHIFPILLAPEIDRPAFMKGLRDRAIQSSVHYNPIHRFSLYQQQYPGVSLPITEEIGRREVTLPMHTLITPDQIDAVCQAVAELTA